MKAVRQAEATSGRIVNQVIAQLHRQVNSEYEMIISIVMTKLCPLFRLCTSIPKAVPCDVIFHLLLQSVVRIVTALSVATVTRRIVITSQNAIPQSARALTAWRESMADASHLH